MKQWQRTGSNGAQVGLSSRASALLRDLVVARGDPDAALVLEAHLRRAEDVAGRMKLRRTPK